MSFYRSKAVELTLIGVSDFFQPFVYFLVVDAELLKECSAVIESRFGLGDAAVESGGRLQGVTAISGFSIVCLHFSSKARFVLFTIGAP